MPVKYVLPCSCGKGQVEVDSSQSGLTVPCPACGQQLTVPTMRGLQQLQIAGAGAGGAAPRRLWGAQQGLLLVAVVLVAVGFGWGGLKGVGVFGTELSDYKAFYPQQDLTLEQTFEYYDYLRNKGLSEAPDEQIQKVTMQYRKEQYQAGGLLLVGVIGLVVGIVALTVFRPAKSS